MYSPPLEGLFGMSDNTRKGEHVDELALLLGHEHGGRLRAVQGDSWYTKKTEIGDLYISLSEFLQGYILTINIQNSQDNYQTVNPNPDCPNVCVSRGFSNLEKETMLTSVEQEEVHTSIGNASRDSSTVEESHELVRQEKIV